MTQTDYGWINMCGYPAVLRLHFMGILPRQGNFINFGKPCHIRSYMNMYTFPVVKREQLNGNAEKVCQN